MPPWRMPPPNAFLILLAFFIKFFEPHINEPIGADKPFERQNETESIPSLRSDGETPKAALALKILAPSTCTFKELLFAISTTFNI